MGNHHLQGRPGSHDASHLHAVQFGLRLALAAMMMSYPHIAQHSAYRHVFMKDA